tara:strand:+ start:33 stop:461 length:429 start_codon:yes stop_codon:yes gene_type:complete
LCPTNRPTLGRPKKNRPVQSVVEHYISLKGYKFFDKVISYATKQDLADVLRFIKIGVRIIGNAHASKQFTVRKYWEENALAILKNLHYKISSIETKLKSTIFLAGDQLLSGSLNAAMIAVERIATGCYSNFRRRFNYRRINF